MEPEPDPIEQLIRQVVQRARGFIAENPPCYRFHSNLVYDPKNHRITLHFNPDRGHGHHIEINTEEPSLEKALKIKQRLQSRIINLPGIDIYRDKARKGVYNPELDRLFPHAPPQRTRLVKRHGMFKIEFTWSDDDVRTFSLGLLDSEINRAEAQQRREYAERYLDEVRQENTGPEFRTDVLPLSKGDLIEVTKAIVQRTQGEWLHAPRFDIDEFPIDFQLPFPKGEHELRDSFRTGFHGSRRDPSTRIEDYHKQKSWLVVRSLVASGDPNPTWSLQLGLKVEQEIWKDRALWCQDGVIKNATAEINLHTHRKDVAERRAIHVVNELLQIFKKQHPHAMWALNDHRLLEDLSSAARSNTNNIDTNRFRTIINSIPRFTDDLEVRVTGLVPYNSKIRFKLGVFRGNVNVDAGQPGELEKLPGENVWEFLGGDNTPLVLERTFEVDARNANKVDEFARAVDERLQETAIEAYRSRIEAESEPDKVGKEVRPRGFKPQTTMAMFKDVLSDVGKKYPDITPLGRGTLDQDGDFKAR